MPFRQAFTSQRNTLLPSTREEPPEMAVPCIFGATFEPIEEHPPYDGSSPFTLKNSAFRIDAPAAPRTVL